MKRVNFRFALLPRLKLSGKDVSALFKLLHVHFRIHILVYLVSVHFCWVFLSVYLFQCFIVLPFLHAHTHISKVIPLLFCLENSSA